MGILIPAAIAALAGVVGSLAFAPVGQALAMIVSLGFYLGVLWWVRYRSGWVSALVGASYGAGFMFVLIWWMNTVSTGGYIALVIAQILMYALGGVGLWLIMRLPLWPLWGAGVWVAFEALRGSQPFSGFPWGRLVHVTAETPLESWVRLIGAPATSGLIFVIIALIVAAVVTPGRVPTVAAGVTAVSALVLGLFLPVGPAGQTHSIEVALVQGDIPGPPGTWPRGEIFAMHVEATLEMADEVDAGERPQPDFVVWPETVLDVEPDRFPRVTEMLNEAEAAVGAPILVGGLLDGPTSDTAYNAGFVWENGVAGDRYVKRNLVPYGEYVPFRQLLGDIVPRIDREIPRDMLHGDQIGSMDIAGIQIGNAICWDIAYDTAIADTVKDGAQLLVIQTSNAPFTGSSQPDQQWDISRLRAIETGRSLAVASTNGITGAVDASGETLAVAPREEPAVLSVEVDLARGETWGVRIGTHALWLWCIAGVAGMALGGSRIRVRRRRGADVQ